MAPLRSKKILEKYFRSADIQIDGNRPWDLKVHDPKFYSGLITGGSLFLGESYMNGWWDCDALDQFFYKICMGKVNKKLGSINTELLYIIKSNIVNRQNKRRSFTVGERHYDIGNDLYKKMLDPRLVYTCAYWKNTKDLNQAQEDKLDLICKKLQLQPGMKVLDLGCGWGSFAKFAAEKYQVEVTGVTVSQEQVSLGRELCKGLPVEIRLQDYREVHGEFDRVSIIGMFEHVGPKNHAECMNVARRNLKDDGLFLLHTIGSNRDSGKDEWVDKYIFPNAIVPSARQLVKASTGRFIIEDWHNFGSDYDKTLMAWYDNFVRNWDDIKSETYDDLFYRMWIYYLMAFAGYFRSRELHLWQIVYSKNGVPGGYQSVR